MDKPQKIKTFISSEPEKLEANFNAWMQQNFDSISVVDKEFAVASNVYSLLVFYTELKVTKTTSPEKPPVEKPKTEEKPASIQEGHALDEVKKEDLANQGKEAADVKDAKDKDSKKK